MVIIYELVIPELCEYGGTQTCDEYDVRSEDMPPIVFCSTVGIQPCLTMS